MPVASLILASGGMLVCVCVRVCVRACVRACVRVCVHGHVPCKSAWDGCAVCLCMFMWHGCMNVGGEHAEDNVCDRRGKL